MKEGGLFLLQKMWNIGSNLFMPLQGIKSAHAGIIVTNQCIEVKPSRPNPGRREKNKLNFYFHTSLQCLKKFYGGL